MVESGSFLSFGLLDGLSGKYCDISFMVGIMAEKQGQHQEMDIRQLQILSLAFDRFFLSDFFKMRDDAMLDL